MPIVSSTGVQVVLAGGGKQRQNAALKQQLLRLHHNMGMFAAVPQSHAMLKNLRFNPCCAMHPSVLYRFAKDWTLPPPATAACISYLCKMAWLQGPTLEMFIELFFYPYSGIYHHRVRPRRCAPCSQLMRSAPPELTHRQCMHASAS